MNKSVFVQVPSKHGEHAGYWDIHNHILPGVDDGASCMEEAMELITAEYQQGIRNIIFTPHYRPGMFMVRAADRAAVYERVCAEAKLKYPDMRFYLGCEYHVHKDMLGKMLDQRYRMAGTDIILLEFSTRTDYATMLREIRQLTKLGYQVVIAHVERCVCLLSGGGNPRNNTHEDVRGLRELGAIIQVNADSVIERGRSQEKRFVRSLLDQDLVDLIASDAHNMDDRPVHMKACIQYIERKYGTERAHRVFADTPYRLFRPRRQ